MANNWSRTELIEAVRGYLRLLDLHRADKPFVKKQYYEEVAEKTGRSPKSIEYRAQNISHVLETLGEEWLPGLLPATNVGRRVTDEITEIILELRKQETSPTKSESQLISDIGAVTTSGKDVERMVLSRLGQGKFRRDVLTLWGNRCCVTGIQLLEVIRASHIRPWKECDPIQKTDPFNGLPLIATLDALFDGGLISFENDGQLIVSSSISSDSRRRLGLNVCEPLPSLADRTRDYLSYHRENVFRG